MAIEHYLGIAWLRRGAKGSELIIEGEPGPDHNCDAMGCGRSHVLHRTGISDRQADQLVGSIKDASLD